MCDSEILEEISPSDLKELIELYKKPEWGLKTKHMLNLFRTSSPWRCSKKYGGHIRYYSIGDCWRNDGTVFCLFTYACYDLVVFTLEDDCANLYKGLYETKLIDFTKNLYIYAVNNRHLPTVLRCLEDRGVKNIFAPDDSVIMYRAPETPDWKIHCPPEVYVAPLDPVAHPAKMDSCWPHRYPGSEDFLSAIVTNNGGWGVFLRADDTLVSWILHHRFGIGTMQTDEKYRRKGYARLVLQHACKQLATRGFRAMGCAWSTNAASTQLFDGLGFQRVDLHTFVSVNLKR